MKRQYWLFIFVVGFLADKAAANSLVKSEWLILPVATLDIASEEITSYQPMLQLFSELTSQNMLQSAQTLAQRLDARVSENKRRMAQKIVVGINSWLPNDKRVIAIQPVWARLGDQFVLQLQLTTPANDVLIAAASRTFAIKDWQEVTPASLPSALEQVRIKTAALLTELRQSVEQIANRVAASSALTVGYALRRNNMRLDSGFQMSLLQLIMEETARAGFKVERNLGGEVVHFIRDQFALTDRLSRKTRVVSLQLADVDVKQISYPLTVQGTVSYVESVFGNSLGEEQSVSFPLQYLESEARFRVSLDQQLHNFLSNEAASLILSDRPQAVAVRGAWVYVDRGRAYGLRINDRLVVAGAENSIQGHVVGYFGPNLQLKSPRGFKVKEGAIIFIRKGQALTKIGQEFAFDQTKSYPTEWPPR